MTLSNLLPKPANFNLTIFDHFVPLKASNSKIPKNDNFCDFWKHYIALTKPVFIGIIYIYVPSNFTPKFFLLKAFRDFWKFFFQPNDTVFEAFFFCIGQIYGTWTRYYKNIRVVFCLFFITLNLTPGISHIWPSWLCPTKVLSWPLKVLLLHC